MKDAVLDTKLERHPIARCDKCGTAWTIDVCEKNGWLLSDKTDLCERCKPQKKGAPGKGR